jgi:hypothetical protein
MYEIFRDPTPSRKSIPLLPEFQYVKSGLARENRNIVRHYRANPTAVKSDHILVRILDNIVVPYGNDPSLHYSQVRAIAYRIANSLRMTSPLDRGHVFNKGYFYGKQTKELIIAVDEPFDIDTIDSTWMDLRPVKVLQHGMTQIVPPLLDGKRDVQSGGYVVIEINIAMLSCQYQAWRRAVAMKQVVPLSVQHFVRTYPIVNMIYSHQDYALFNRLNAIDTEAPVSPWAQLHSFPYIDYQRRIDEALGKYSAVARRSRLDYKHLLTMLPSISLPTMWDTLQLPDLPPMIQVEWLLTIARLPAIAFILRMDTLTRSSENTAVKNHWRQSIREWRSDKTMVNVLGPEAARKIESYVKTNIENNL